jgi:septum site-determining protein MinD
MIVAVAGGKGGVGKSTVALNLGAAMDAVVVDGDLAMADLPGGRGPDLHDVLAGRADPLEAVRGGGPVAVLPCGRTLAGARDADVEALAGVVAAVEGACGPVVVDTPAGLAADAGLALHAADCSVLVTTAASSAIAGALRTRELARELDAGVAGVVLNRVEGRPPREAVRDALGAPVTAVPESPAVATAREEGRPVDAGREAAGRFRDLAATVRSASTGR